MGVADFTSREGAPGDSVVIGSGVDTTLFIVANEIPFPLLLVAPSGMRSELRGESASPRGSLNNEKAHQMIRREGLSVTAGRRGGSVPLPVQYFGDGR